MDGVLSAATFIALYGLSYGVVLFTVSIGLVVMMGLMRVVNLAHGAFAAIGGYLAVSLMNRYGIPFWLSVPLAVAAVAVFSLVIERLCFVHLYAATELEQVLSTTGLMFVAVAGLNLVFGPDILAARLPPVLAANVDLGVRTFQAYRLFIIGVGAVLIVALWYVFDRTNFGARLRAAVDNRGMAQAVGIDVSRLFSLAFALGCALAAFGGAVGFGVLPLEPLYPFKYLTLVLIVVTLSGFSNIKASAAVAILIGLVDTAGRYLFPDYGAFVIYVVLILLMARRRQNWFAPANATMPPMATAAGNLLSRHRIKASELVFWAAVLGAFFVFPNELSFASSVLIMALFAMSLDLILGFAGVVTIGHAVYYGIGAYCAGLLALAGHGEAISGALLAGTLTALLAAAVGPFVLRLGGLPLIMVTLSVCVIVFEAANKAQWLTGGDNGLQGIVLDPLLGLFRWSVYGQTAYFYVFAWLAVLFLVARLVISSAFGVALQGIRENRGRMMLLGAPVLGQLVGAYALSAFMAGVAGALSAQTTKFVGLEVLSLSTSIDVLVMLVLGGIGRLYGGLVGAMVYMTVYHFAAEWNPYHWMFVIGGLLIVVVRFASGGVLGMLDSAARRFSATLRLAAK